MNALESGSLPAWQRRESLSEATPIPPCPFGIRGAPFSPRGSTLALPRQSLSPQSCHPPTGAHHHNQAPSTVRGHPNICHLKLFHYFNDSGRDSPPCCGCSRGAAPFPASAAGRRELCDGDHCPPMRGIRGLPSPPQGCSPAPAGGRMYRVCPFCSGIRFL